MSEPPQSRRPRWHWLLLLTPAVELMMAPWLFKAQPGFLLIADLLQNLWVAGALCVALGFWWGWRKPDPVWSGLGYTLALMAVNGGVAFAGCALGASLVKP